MNNASRAKDLLKKKGFKVTKNRVCVLDFLIKSSRPLTAEEISQKLMINIVTIYRILEAFVSKNLIYQTDFRQGKSFFEYQDEHHHHHHIICTECNKREHLDFCLDEKTINNLKKKSSFVSIDSHILEFFGVCKKCAKK